ncbi:hypothetical protein [Bremerella sp. TYQ1]|uniref:hypothetical protein n=1 Tax=Bremerella sp. TYQ1 TaxID=3119568 RepID=UPI001CCBB240|nr:hypothetical protein [Bremerella volcania]UBM38435.1 hypothetical protein LA756_11165 [Bremerella volcania]
MLGYSPLGSTPLAKEIRRVIIQGGSTSANCNQPAAAASITSTVSTDPIQSELELATGGLVPSVSVQGLGVELQAFHLADQATAGGSIDLAAIELEAIKLDNLAAGTATTSADPIAADLVAVSLFLEQTSQLQPRGVEVLETTSATYPAAATTLAPGAISLEGIADVGQLQAWRTIPTDPLEVDLEKTAGGLVPSVSISLPGVELQAFHLADQATAGGSIDLAAVELEAIELPDLVVIPRTIPAGVLEAELGMATADLVYTMIILSGGIELQAFQMPRQATAGGSVDLAAVELSAGQLGGVASGVATTAAGLIGADLVAAGEFLEQSANWQAFPFEAILGPNSIDPIAAAGLAPGAIELLAGQAVHLANGSIALAAGGVELLAGTEKRTFETELLIQFFSFDLMAKPSQAESQASGAIAAGVLHAAGDLVAGQLQAWQFMAADPLEGYLELATAGVLTSAGIDQGGLELQAFHLADKAAAGGAIAAGILHAAGDLVAGQLQAWQFMAADPLEVDLEKTAGGLVPSVSIRLPAVELQAYNLVDQVTAGGSIDLAAVEIFAGQLGGVANGSRTIPAGVLEAQLQPIAWRGFGPVLIAPPELVYTLPSAWPYYALADNRLALDLDDQRLAFDLVDHRLGYDLAPGWYQFDLRDNLPIYRIEE